jgi:serine/threonine protein kinase
MNGIALKIGTELNEFTIEKILGAGTFGVTYLAKDNYLDKQVVIKEYFPNDIAMRERSGRVFSSSKSNYEFFEYGLNSFLKEAKTLAMFKHPNIVRINSFFETNNTAYFVMDYDRGEDLEIYLKNNPNLSEDEILNIMLPILDGLREVHKKSYLHRDIKPANIYIRENHQPMLIDFGATRYSIGAKSQLLSIILTPGYAPKEQYSSGAKQKAYTDIYAIGAVMYRMVTGATPVEASERANAITDDEPDPHIKLSKMDYPKYSNNFKEAIDWAMEFRAKDRPKSVKEFQDALKKEDKEEEIKEYQPIKPPVESGSNIFKYLIIAILFIALGAGGFIFMNKNSSSGDRDNSSEIERLKAENRRLEEQRLKAEQEAQRVSQIAQQERERATSSKNEQMLQKPMPLVNIDFSKKKQLNISNDNITLTLSYYENVKKGEKIFIKATLQNGGKKAIRGGITLGFPQLNSIKGGVISNDFDAIKTYDTSNKIWSKAENRQIYGKYLMVESNDERWSRYEKHTFIIAVDTPNHIGEFKVQVRGALRSRIVPKNGTIDQQGYPCKVITINIVD